MVLLVFCFIFVSLHSVVQDARGRIDQLFDDGSYAVFNTDTIEGNNLVEVLFDLLNYKDGELCLSAAQLLFDMHSRRSLLMASVRDVYLVTPPMTEFLKKVLKIANLSEESPRLLETLDELCQQCVQENDENEPAICQQSILYSSGELMSSGCCMTCIRVFMYITYYI